MRWMKIAALCISVAWTSPRAFAVEAAPTADVKKVLSGLADHYKTVKTLKAEIMQITITPMGDEITMKGKVLVERPRMARWELNGGGQDSLFVSDGTTGWLYTPAARQAVKMKDQGAGGGSIDPLDLVNTLDERFDVRAMPEGGTERWVFEAVPKAGTQLAGQYKLLRVEVDQRSKLPLRLVLNDHFGGSTDIRFTEGEFNVTIPPESFRFTPPAGVTVVGDGGL